MSEHKWICPHCRQTGINVSSIPCPPSCPNYIAPPDPLRSAPVAQEKLRALVDRMNAYDSDDGYVIRNWANELDDIADALASASASPPTHTAR